MKGMQPALGERPRVLMIGPMAPAVGGMVTVIEQLMAGPLNSSFELVRHPANGVAVGWRSPLRSAWRHLRQIVRLGLHLRRVDVVHIHTCSGFTFYRNLIDAFISRLAGVPVVLHVHGAQFDRFCAGAGRFGRWVIRRGLTGADRVVVLSDRWRSLLCAVAPQARFIVVPNGVPVPTHLAGEPGPDQAGPCRFLFLAAICHRKGIDILLDAVAKLRARGVDFHLTVAGPEEQPGEARTLTDAVRRLGLDDYVMYAGVKTGADKEALLDGCDCLVLPSRAEGLPLSLLEAGARGRAVVAADVGAVGEVIADERYGLLVPPEDAERFAAAMEVITTDADRRRAMGRSLHDRVAARFSLKHQSALLAEVYGELCRRSSTAEVGPAVVAGGGNR